MVRASVTFSTLVMASLTLSTFCKDVTHLNNGKGVRVTLSTLVMTSLTLSTMVRASVFFNVGYDFCCLSTMVRR